MIKEKKIIFPLFAERFFWEISCADSVAKDTEGWVLFFENFIMSGDVYNVKNVCNFLKVTPRDCYVQRQ